jgi:hypothetical protein
MELPWVHMCEFLSGILLVLQLALLKEMMQVHLWEFWSVV